jgi:O-antigen/teichoic acid export membrane protein
MQQTRKFAFDVSWVLISSAVNLALGFALRIILARWLGSFDLGLYTLVLTVQEFATLIAGMGIMTALTKYVAQYRDDKNALFQIVFSAFTLTLFFAIVAGLLLYFLATTIAGIFHTPQLAHLLRILSISLPFIIINQTSLGLENGLRRMKYYAAQIMMRSFLMIVFIVVLVWLGYGVEGTVWGLVFAIAGTSIWGLYLAREYYHLNYHNFIKNVKTLISFGIQVFSVETVNVLVSYTDILMIGYFLTATEVGYYSIAVSMGMLFYIFPQAVQKMTFPLTAEYWYANDFESLRKMFDKSMKYTACILLPLGLFFTLFAREITTTVFGAEYIYSVSPFLILLIDRVLRGSTITPVGASFSGIGRPDISLKVDSVSLVMNAFLCWLLIPRFGIIGASMATATSMLTAAAIYTKLLPKLKVKLDFRWYGLAVGLLGTAIAVNWIGAKFINHYVVASIIFVAYVILVLRFFLTREDRNLLKSLAFSFLKIKPAIKHIN